MEQRLVFLWSLIVHFGFGVSLKLSQVTIPEYGVKDASTTLRCEFDLESQSEKLFALKWFKNEKEFFRFSPYGASPILTFPVQGIFIDLTKSNLNQVYLKNITFDTIGNYRCEVSLDKPTYRTLSKSSNMSVIAIPKSAPEISGFLPVAKVGENIVGNCTIHKSKPAASLNLLINNEKADTFQVREYKPIEDSEGMITSLLGIRIYVESKYFNDGKMVLKCAATLANRYWVSNVTIIEASYNFQKSTQGRNRYSSDGNLRVQFENQNIFILALLSFVILI